MNRHVIGLFYDSGDSRQAIEALRSAGVGHGEISMLATREAGYFECVELTRILEGAPAGGRVADGPGLGATLIGGGGASGGVLAVGPLLVALAGLSFGSPLCGIVGALVGIGLPEHEGRFYEDEVVSQGALLIGVATLRHDDARIAFILHRHKAANIIRAA